MRIAIEEGTVPPAVGAGLQELGFSLWFVPRSEARETARLIREFPPDLAVLPLEPRTAHAVEMLQEALPSMRILVVADQVADLKVQPDWADMTVPKNADVVLWMLTILSLGPAGEGVEHGPGGWRQTLLRAVQKTHEAFRAINRKGDRADALLDELRERLGESYTLLLRLLLDRLERDIAGFAGHSARVSELARGVAQKLNLPEPEVEAATMAGLLHDLGMHLVLPTQSLRRPGPLHEGEWQVVRSHPIASAAVVSPLMSDVATLGIREHHERLDGTGYPMSKRGDQISTAARIVAVTDAYQAMTHPRPHRQALSPEQALEALGDDARRGRLDTQVLGALTELAR